MSAQLLPIRKIGKDDVSAIGYGAMSIQSSRPGVVTDEERLKVCLSCYDEFRFLWGYEHTE